LILEGLSAIVNSTRPILALDPPAGGLVLQFLAGKYGEKKKNQTRKNYSSTQKTAGYSNQKTHYSKHKI